MRGAQRRQLLVTRQHRLTRLFSGLSHAHRAGVSRLLSEFTFSVVKRCGSADVSGKRPVMPRCPPIGGIGLGLACQHIPECTAVRLAAFFAAIFHRAKTQPHGMAGAGKGHVQQAQVFAQTGFVGLSHIVVGDVQAQGGAPVRPSLANEAELVFADRAEPRGKRQAHHRVLQAFAFVHGDDLDQVGITFQPHHLLVVVHIMGLRFGVQPADERLLAVQARTGGLQQLGQVQQVGQAALAFRRLQPAAG